MNAPDSVARGDAESYKRIAAAHLRDLANPRLRYLAVPYYQKALALEPGNTQTLLELAGAYRKLGNSREAIACCERALAMDPDLVEAQVRCCTWQIPVIQGREEDIEPSRRNYHGGLLRLDAMLASAGAEVLAHAARGALTATMPLQLAYQGYDVRELQALYGGIVSRVMAAVYPQWTVPPAQEPTGPGDKIRVGLVSPNFRDNQHWRMLIKGWLSQLDRGRYAVFCYALGSVADAVADYARGFSESFVAGERTFEDWCQAIRRDNLHVLIYPEMGTDGLGERLAALRLARVQCVAWANPLTSGLPTIDYFLSSDLAEPAGAQAHYTEELVRLPNLSNYLEPIEWSAADDKRADLGLRDEAVVYFCHQWLLKYLPQYDAVFPRIASAVPNCQFVFSSRFCLPSTVWVFERRLEQAFAAHGLRWEDYVVIGPNLSPPRYHRLCQLSDVFVDSLGFSGGTSTIEAALAHNLPVVTFAGEFMRGRLTLAIMGRMGVTETSATSVSEFVDIAVRLGRDLNFRRHIAEQIAANKHKVYHDKAAIAGLEEFLESVAGAPGADRARNHTSRA